MVSTGNNYGNGLGDDYQQSSKTSKIIDEVDTFSAKLTDLLTIAGNRQ